MSVPVDDRRAGSGVPARSVAQREEALRRANETRFARARLKRSIAAGEVSARDVILSPEPYVATMKVLEVLKAIPHVGPYKSEAMLRIVHASPAKTLAGLSERQRVELAAWVK